MESLNTYHSPTAKLVAQKRKWFKTMPANFSKNFLYKTVFLFSSLATIAASMDAPQGNGRCPIRSADQLMKMLYAGSGDHLSATGIGVTQTLADNSAWKIEAIGSDLRDLEAEYPSFNPNNQDSIYPYLLQRSQGNVPNYTRLKFPEMVSLSSKLNITVGMWRGNNFADLQSVGINCEWKPEGHFEINYKLDPLAVNNFNKLAARAEQATTPDEKISYAKKALHSGLPATNFRFKLTPLTPFQPPKGPGQQQAEEQARRQHEAEQRRAQQEQEAAQRAAEEARRQREAENLRRAQQQEAAQRSQEQARQQYRAQQEAAQRTAEEARRQREADIIRQRQEEIRSTAQEQLRQQQQAQQPMAPQPQPQPRVGEMKEENGWVYRFNGIDWSRLRRAG
ncbi:hypothetical protein [Candidatus Odyssella thessalonicensis]|uniref:hypothetical protein n=1 Tax=Candidatus Odyssella thessalonicensis TaxID=84647 RepID=UPI000225B4D7|nr:hypothetical protein [Candidatus Odyssella thessalonicensis]